MGDSTEAEHEGAKREAKKDLLVVERQDMPPLPWLDDIADPIARVSELAERTLRVLLVIRDLTCSEGATMARSCGLDPLTTLHERLADLLALGVALRAELRGDNARVADALVAARDPIRVGDRGYVSAHVAVLELAARVLRGRDTHADLALSPESVVIPFLVDPAEVPDVLRDLDVAVITAALRYEHEHARAKALGRASQRDPINAREKVLVALRALGRGGWKDVTRETERQGTPVSYDEVRTVGAAALRDKRIEKVGRAVCLTATGAAEARALRGK